MERFSEDCGYFVPKVVDLSSYYNCRLLRFAQNEALL